MGYTKARERLETHRNNQISALLGESAHMWFPELWGDVGSMLKSFDTSEENKTAAGVYASGSALSKVVPNILLDYVCGLRREVRKQFISGESDICTDVSPFRHGVMSAHGAMLFDNLLNSVVGGSESSGGNGGNVA